MPANLRAAPEFCLLEFEKDPRLMLGRDADAGIAYQEIDLAGRCAGFDDERNAARLGELDRVAGEVEENLAQARGVAEHTLRQGVFDIGGDFQRLRLRTRCDQLHCLFDQRGEIERPRREIEPAGLDLGEIENLLDQREQRVAGRLHRLRIGRLLWRERRIEQEVRHPEDAVKRRPDLMRHHCEEA